MAYTNDPTNIIDRVRLMIGDTDTANEHLSDDWYTYFLGKYSNNEVLSAIDAAKSILARFTSNTREKVDQIEIWGNLQFDNYLLWLKDFIENPAISGLRSPAPYAGGISKSDMASNDSNSDNVTVEIKRGFIENPDPEYISEYWRFP